MICIVLEVLTEGNHGFSLFWMYSLKEGGRLDLYYSGGFYLRGSPMFIVCRCLLKDNVDVHCSGGTYLRKLLIFDVLEVST